MTFPPRSCVNREAAVLVVIDVQERLAGAMEHGDRVIDRCRRLIGVADIVSLPVIATRQYPKGLGDTHSSVKRALDAAVEGGTSVVGVDKVTFSCLDDSAFRDALASAGRSQVMLVGMETHICVAQTAIALLGEGFDVHVVADATCSRNDEDHSVALERLRAAGATVTTAEAVMYELVGRADSEEFRRLLAIVKG